MTSSSTGKTEKFRPSHTYHEHTVQSIKQLNEHNIWQNCCMIQHPQQRKDSQAVGFPLPMDKSWIRCDSKMPTNQTDPVYVNTSPIGLSDDPDLLEVLSLYEGEVATDDYDKDFDAAVSIDSSLSAKSSGDDTVDASIGANRATGSLQHISSACSSNSLNCSSNTTKSMGRNSPVVKYRGEFGSSEIGLAQQRPFGLTINSEPFRNIAELPSPSSASLHSANEQIALQELATKSNSAPILLKKEKVLDQFSRQLLNLRYSRSQSDRYLAEIEAIEACKWLRAAGFPQYAQMYEDLQFPIDLSNVAKDHPFLENDPLQSLYRRLVALNKCATMRLDSAHKHANKEDSEDDDIALSENWTFQQNNRRWSRVGEMEMEKPRDSNLAANISRDSSPEQNELLVDEDLGFSTLPPGSTISQQSDSEQLPVRLRRTGSERLKDGAKAFLQRVESIKSRRNKRQNRKGIVLSGPDVLALTDVNSKMNNLKTVDIVTMSTPPSPVPTSPYMFNCGSGLNNNELKVFSDLRDKSPNWLSPKYFPASNAYQAHGTSSNTGFHKRSHSNRTSPLHFFSQNNSFNKSGDEYYSDASQDSTGDRKQPTTPITKKRPSRTRRFLQKGSKVEDIGAFSDSECHHFFVRKQKGFKEPEATIAEKPVSSKFSRGGSLNLRKESQSYKEAFKSRSFRSRSSARVRDKTNFEKEFEQKFKSNSVIRWHSFQSSERPDFLFKKCGPNKIHDVSDGQLMASMSSGKLQVLRKLSLVTLTGYMERHCPTHRSGWNWELPKFIKKIKTPDYKDKKVFGVPLVLQLQRTGQVLPVPIQIAMKWIKMNALDQVGIFRKSGVKSRIAKLREAIEESSQNDTLDSYDLQQAYDVADMLKQYFRELPDSLLTTKMSDTFVAIFQHLPEEVRPDAVQCAILLLPDEQREVLFYLLEFLHAIAGHAMFNQMTANNLAVCMAPSLFYGMFTNSTPRSTSVSPRRRKAGTGMADSRELTETRASHDCLTYMIENYRKIYSISSEKIQRCNFGYMEESRPVPLEALGEGLHVHDWRGYLYECTSATIKEGRERSRGWISVTSLDPTIDIAFKKVGDGHPLRLWRCVTEVDAPPCEVMQFIYNERQQWDPYLLKWRVIEHLDDRSEIFQFATGWQSITDYCILRSWRSDLPRGACVIVETSVAHNNATLLMGGVRGVVLASRYLIEPSGNDRAKVMHLARIDTKGRSPDWYNKCYGHICALYLAKVRAAFRHIPSGSGTKN